MIGMHILKSEFQRKEVKIAKVESNNSQPRRCALPKGNSSEQTEGLSQAIGTDTQRFRYVRIAAADENMSYLSVRGMETRIIKQKLREAGRKGMMSMAR